jgi:hypothetical protein
MDLINKLLYESLCYSFKKLLNSKSAKSTFNEKILEYKAL